VTDNTSTNGYFDEAGREGAPSAKLKEKKDFVKGEVVDLFYIPMTDFSTKKVLLNDDGSERTQLVLVLQTSARNWDKVAKVPIGADGSAKDPKLDDGKRAVYVPKFTNIYAALGKAVKAAGAKDVLIGGNFGIVVEDLQDTGKGNPLKVFRAKYEPPAKSATVVDEEDPLGEDLGDKGAAGPAKTEERPQDETESPTSANASAAEAEVEEPPF
jgi:hypothetical protein